MQAVVLAGGLATRMRPKTLTIPKAMLEVAGRPFVDWQLERLAEAHGPSAYATYLRQVLEEALRR